jgi:hypothetical protein
MPRWVKATTATWESWLAGVGRGWTAVELDAATRLIEIVDDLNRTNDPGERRRLTATIRTGERDLGLRQLKAKPKWKRTPNRIRLALGIGRGEAQKLLDENPTLTVEQIVRLRRPDWIDATAYGFYEQHGQHPTNAEKRERAFAQHERWRGEGRISDAAGGSWTRTQWERAFPGTQYPAEIYEQQEGST